MFDVLVPSSRAPCYVFAARPLEGPAAVHAALREVTMPDQIYKVVEVVGTSDVSISKAIDAGIAKAGETLRHLGWFEVVQIRGNIDGGSVKRYQVTMKVGFTLE